MKKILLSLATAAAAVTMSAAPAQTWLATAQGLFAQGETVYDAKVAIDPTGATVAAGAFSQDFTLAGTTLEAIGTSAYLVKYNATGAALWAVSFTGSASVTAIDTDAEGNIYVGGSFADEVEFGTTSGTPSVQTGMMIDGDATVEQNAAFIAKYTPAGVLADIRTFVPSINAELIPLINDWDAFPGYYYGDGDVAVNITDLKADGGKVYAAVVYTGTTAVGDVTLDAGYVNYFGFMYQDCKKASVLSFDATLDNATVIETIGTASDNGGEVYDLDMVWNAKIAVKGDDMFAAYTGCGTLLLGNDYIFGEYDGPDVAGMFIYGFLKNGVRTATYSFGAGAPTKVQDNFVSDVQFVGDNVYIGGRTYLVELVGEGDDQEKVRTQSLFASVIPSMQLGDLATLTMPAADGDVTFSSASAAALPGGDVYVTTTAVYNEGVEGHRTGDFAGIGKTFVFSSLTAGAQVAQSTITALNAATSGDFLATATVADTDATFALYKADQAGIDDITVDQDATVEYFNLQGIRVAEPADGIYIVRQGNAVTKQLIRR